MPLQQKAANFCKLFRKSLAKLSNAPLHDGAPPSRPALRLDRVRPIEGIEELNSFPSKSVSEVGKESKKMKKANKIQVRFRKNEEKGEKRYYRGRTQDLEGSGHQERGRFWDPPLRS